MFFLLINLSPEMNFCSQSTQLVRTLSSLKIAVNQNAIVLLPRTELISYSGDTFIVLCVLCCLHVVQHYLIHQY